MRHLLYITFFLHWGVFSFSQEGWEKINLDTYLNVILNLEKDIPTDQSYSHRSETRIFDDYEATQPVEIVRSFLLCKEGQVYNLRQNEYFIIQENDLNLMIDSLRNEIVLQYADSSFFYRKKASDYVKIGEITKVIYQKKEKGRTTYLLELLAGYPYTAVEFVVVNNWIQKIICYSSSPYDLDPYSNKLARFEMSFEDFQIGKKALSMTVVSPSDYVKEEGGEMILQPSKTHYKLIDLRNK